MNEPKPKKKKVAPRDRYSPIDRARSAPNVRQAMIEDAQDKAKWDEFRSEYKKAVRKNKK